MIELERIAPLSGVQDSGRGRWRAEGVPLSGPLDDWSHAVSNILVGNAQEAAALEVGFGHSRLRFLSPAIVAIAGARCLARIDGVAAPLWRPIWLAEGSVLSLSPGRQGARSYLAVAGGFSMPVVLGSQSAMVGHRYFPSMARSGERLAFAARVGRPWSGLNRRIGATRALAAPWWVDGEPLLDLDGHAALRIIDGAHARLLRDRRALFTQSFKLSSASNRMAALLEGTRIDVEAAGSLTSEPVVPGTLQLPPDGRPVVLLADAQTVGGYPRIGHLAGVDLSRLAQRRPGAELRFEPISVDLAQRLWIWRQERLARMTIAVEARILPRM